MSIKHLLSFTQQLDELLQGDVPLKDGIKQIMTAHGQEKIVEEFARQIYFALENGDSFYEAICAADRINVPVWYKTFILAAGETGELKKTCRYLCNKLKEKTKSKENFLSALFYPQLVILLTLAAGVLSAVFMPVLFPQMMVEDDFRGEAIKNVAFDSGALLLAGIGFVWFISRWWKEDVSVLLFRALSFLTESGVPVVRALENCLCLVEKNCKFGNAILETRNKIMSGIGVDCAFGEGFENNGLEKESRLLGINLNIVCDGNVSYAFERIGNTLEEGRIKKCRRVESMIQPAMLIIAAIYMVIILKDTILPLLLSSGGIL